jgi:CheY-like chemotaxis protein
MSTALAEATLNDPESATTAPDPAVIVLVVDDSAGMRETLAGLLEPYWEVRTAASADAALEAVRQARPALVLADLVLPGTDGIGLLRALRSDPDTADVPVVLLSAHDGPETVAKSLEAGADDFLVKPITPDQFLARVRTHMHTARIRSQLREQASLFQAQIEAMPQAVIAVGPDRLVMACNRRFEELWGLEPGSVAPGTFSPALQEPSRRQVRDPAAFEEAIRWGHSHPDEEQRLEVPLRDGRVIEGVAGPIVTDDGRYRGRIWFLSDDTERRRAEATRLELLDRIQVAQAAQAFLLQAAQALARSTTYNGTLTNLAEVAVPTLGDICLIDVRDQDGAGLRRMASRHVDPTRQALVDLLASDYPPDPEGGHPTIQVLATGQSVWSETMSDAFLRATSRDEEHFRIVKELGFESFMTVPLTDRGEVLGAITMISAGSGRRFGRRDLSLAEDLAGQVATVVGKARRYEQEHLAAHTLQSTLLPAALPPAPGLRVAVRYLPGTRGAEVGGDWYDLVSHPSGASILAVGDVSGHDMGAAAAMGAVRSGLRALMRHADDPASLVELVQLSWDDLAVDRMATLVVVFVDGKTGEFTVASAGHPPPLLVPAVGRPRFLPVEPAPPLGCPPGRVGSYRGELEPGDLILLYSDGLIESREESIDAGLDHLAEMAAQAGTHPERFCSRILSGLKRERTDDIALLAATRDIPD